MENSTLQHAFEEWIGKNYKRQVALQLCRALESAEGFLRETAGEHDGLLDCTVEKAAQLLDGLNRNRVFRFRCKDASLRLGKLIHAIREFSTSEAYISMHEVPHDAQSEAAPDGPASMPGEGSGASPDEGKLPALSPTPETPEGPGEPEDPGELGRMGKAIRSILEKCQIKLDNMVISEEAISQSLLAFFSRTSEHKKHNIGIVLHTGSVIFDALAVFWAAVVSLLANETSPEETVRAMQKGDLVICNGKERCQFEELTTINGEEYAILATANQRNCQKSCIKVPRSRWAQIKPYEGNATNLGRRGVRKGNEKKRLFYSKVLNMDEQTIPSVPDTSTVFVMPEKRAGRLMDGLSICFGCETVNLLDLVTAAFYTDESQKDYPGNSGKNEPVLKFASRLSVARKQIVKREGNRCVGLFVCGEDALEKSETELPEMLARKSLQYVFALANISGREGQRVVDGNREAEVFACTREFLRSLPPLAVHVENDCTKELQAQVGAILDHQDFCESAENGMDWNTYDVFLRNMSALKNCDVGADEKEDFIRGAWFTFKLLRTMVFPVGLLERMAEAGELKTTALEPWPGQLLGRLEETAASLSAPLQEVARGIVYMLRRSYEYLCAPGSDDAMTKEKLLRKLVAVRADRRVCVVVPKGWYEVVLRASGLYGLMESGGELTVVADSRFDRNALYDTIINVDGFHGKRFDCFRCMSAPEIIALACGFERELWKARRERTAHAFSVCNERAHICVSAAVPREEAPCQEGATETDAMDAERAEEDIDAFVLGLQQRSSPDMPYARGTGDVGKETEIAAVVTFETGERAYLTPFYKACVFDEAHGKVEEKQIRDSDLHEGDLVVFTRNDNEMHDIIDDILKMLLASGRLPERVHLDYARSMAWKNKLRCHAHRYGLKPKDIAKLVTEGGAPVTEQTVRIWMDADAHTVGPREKASIREIGRIVQDLGMEQKPEVTMEACGRIRKRRRKILKVIEQSIIDKLSGRKSSSSDPVTQEIYSRIDSQADILPVASFTRVEQKMILSTYANRPIDHREVDI